MFAAAFKTRHTRRTANADELVGVIVDFLSLFSWIPEPPRPMRLSLEDDVTRKTNADSCLRKSSAGGWKPTSHVAKTDWCLFVYWRWIPGPRPPTLYVLGRNSPEDDVRKKK